MSSVGNPSSHRQMAIWTVVGGVCAVIGLVLALVQFTRADESGPQPPPPPPVPPPAGAQPPGPEPPPPPPPAGPQPPGPEPPPPPPPPDAVLDLSLTPLFGADSVATGFPDDPLDYSILAGGAVDASYLDGCNGYATQAPTLELAWEGAGGPLSFVFVADIPGEDGTLVINAADSSWACDDDSYGDRNPLVEFPAAVSGTYDIWVGSFAANTTIAGTLFVTELPP